MPLDINQLKQLDLHAKSRQFTDEDYQLLRTLLGSHKELINLLKDPAATQEDLDRYLAKYEHDTATEHTTSDRIESSPENVE
jgi:hypothetical protein